MNTINSIKMVIVLLAAACFGHGQVQNTMGLLIPAGTATANATNSANARVSFMFTPDGSKTISKVRIYMATLTGTLATGDLQLDIYASAEGKPTGSSLATATSTVTPASTTWQEWTGLSLAVTQGVPYHLVVRNLHATPASNHVTIRSYQYISHVFGAGGTNTLGALTSTDGGSTWSVISHSVGVFRIEYSNATYQGAIYTAGPTVAVSSNYRVYGTRSWGARFTTPANGSMSVSHCIFQQVRGTGTPTGTRCRIYTLNTGGNTATSLGVSIDYPLSTYIANNATGMMMFQFSSPVTLAPSTEYIMALESTNTGDSSANYTTGAHMSNESTAASLGLNAFDGTLRSVYCAGTCTTWSNWTQVDTDSPLVALVLTRGAPFVSTGGGSSGGSYVFVK